MGDVIFQNNKVLFAGGKVAMHQDCCCGVSGCGGCSGKAPKEFLVSSSGVGDGNCDPDECDPANGDFVVSFDSKVAGSCLWIYTPASPLTLCDQDNCHLRLQISLITGQYYFTVSWRGGSPAVTIVIWDKVMASAFDCMNLNNYALNPAPTLPKKCEEIGSSCTVTAL